jgi:hypothetical protein
VTDLAEPTSEVDTDDLNEMYEFLVNAEVVEGPPIFRQIIAELWPALLHKVKPPFAEMHSLGRTRGASSRERFKRFLQRVRSPNIANHRQRPFG